MDNVLRGRIIGSVYESDIQAIVARWKSLPNGMNPTPIQAVKELLLNVLTARVCNLGLTHPDTLTSMHTFALFFVQTRHHIEGQQMC